MNKWNKFYVLIDLIYLVLVFIFANYFVFPNYISDRFYYGVSIIFIGIYVIRFLFRPSYEEVIKLKDKGWKITGYYSKKSLNDKKIYIDSYDFWVKINLVLLSVYFIVSVWIKTMFNFNIYFICLHVLILIFLQILAWIITLKKEKNN